MNCRECSEKMGCIYSVPIGERLRFRVHKCKVCGWQLETVEQPMSLLGLELEEIRERVEKAKKMRYFAIKNRKG